MVLHLGTEVVQQFSSLHIKALLLTFLNCFVKTNHNMTWHCHGCIGNKYTGYQGIRGPHAPHPCNQLIIGNYHNQMYSIVCIWWVQVWSSHFLTLPMTAPEIHEYCSLWWYYDCGRSNLCESCQFITVNHVNMLSSPPGIGTSHYVSMMMISCYTSLALFAQAS